MFSRIGRLYRAQWQALGNLAPSWREALWRIVLSALASAIAFGLATWLTPGITPVDQPSVVTAVILLGVFDVIVRPVLLAVALPIGLIAVALVGLLLRIIAFALILPAAGYEADSFVSILIASLIYGAVQTALSGIIGMSDEDSFSARTVAQVMRDDTDRVESDVPGVLVIQIDGLAAPLLRAQVRAGNLPTLSTWIRGGGHRMTEWTALLPSQTGEPGRAPAWQQRRDSAFRWYEKENRRLLVSNHPESTGDREAAVVGRRPPCRRGASIDNLFSGDATISRLTMSKVGVNEDQAGATRSLYYFVLNPYSRPGDRPHPRRGREGGVPSAPAAAARDRAAHAPGWHLPVPARCDERRHARPEPRARQRADAAWHAGDLRRLSRLRRDAHHSGPERSEALHSLEGIDRALARLEKHRDLPAAVSDRHRLRPRPEPGRDVPPAVR